MEGTELPILSCRADFLKKLEDHQVVFVSSATGSGKTTVIPQLCLEIEKEKGGRKVVCTLPRRLAAKSVAQYVAKQRGSILGQEVGYRVRHDNKCGRNTKLSYDTDGVVMHSAICNDRLLKHSNIGVLIVDEVHERTVPYDLLLPLLKSALLPNRKDMKFVIMSATMKTDKFVAYFQDSPDIFDYATIDIRVRQHPVEIAFTENPAKNRTEEAIRTILALHKTEERGDFLWFLHGAKEIEKAAAEVKTRLALIEDKVGKMVVYVLYSKLPDKDQENAVNVEAPPDKNGLPSRKLIITTNIAETSITVPNVTVVIDCGYSKQKVFDPKTNMEFLILLPISQAAAEQRAGRAGRTCPGKCFRLYTQAQFDLMPEYNIPPITRSRMDSTMMQMAGLSFHNPILMDYIDAPPPALVGRALSSLNFLGALKDYEFNGVYLNELGKLLIYFPIDPQLAKTLITSKWYNCFDEVVNLVSMLSVHNCFLRPVEKEKEADEQKDAFIKASGDHGEHITLLTVLNQYAAERRALMYDKKLETKMKKWCRDHYVSYSSLEKAFESSHQLRKIVGEKKNIKKLDKILNKDAFGPGSMNKGDYTNICKALLSGFFEKVAFSESNDNSSYVTLGDNVAVEIHKFAKLPATGKHPWVVFSDCSFNGAKYFIRTVTPIDPKWLEQVAGRYCRLKSFPVALA